MSVTANAEGVANEGWKQFIKFCLIGASSTGLDIVIARLLIDKCGMSWYKANTLSFLVAVSNGYLWNSLWTFRGMGAARRHTQYIKFVVVNLIGYGLSNVIMALIFKLCTGHVGGEHPLAIWGMAKGTAVLLGAIWNFFANKRWTFAEARV